MVLLPLARWVDKVPPTVNVVPAALSKPPKLALPFTTKEPFLKFKLLSATLSW